MSQGTSSFCPGLLSSRRSSVIRRGSRMGWAALGHPIAGKAPQESTWRMRTLKQFRLDSTADPIQKNNYWRILLFGNNLMHESQKMKIGEPQVFKCKVRLCTSFSNWDSTSSDFKSVSWLLGPSTSLGLEGQQETILRWELSHWHKTCISAGN